MGDAEKLQAMGDAIYWAWPHVVNVSKISAAGFVILLIVMVIGFASRSDQ